ncbi:MAG TPA: prepilin-type N-terminal cleavage/methylation domain-containing protein [Candidatus Tenderia sp.]|nr:prepilin-type N-terminal cleavage/methylation domain-containing protein [Candidatus Tenderia sp.]
MKNRRLHPAKQRGLSLIELMISITIGLIIAAGIMQIFISNKQTYRVQEGMARMQENGRFAIDLLSRDLRMAGYYGCWTDASTIVNTLNDAGTDPYNFNVSLVGSDNTGVNGSDTITLRGAIGNGISLTAAMPDSSADLSSQPAVPPPLATEDIVVVSDCAAAAVFQITNYTDANGNTVHNTGGGSIPGNSTKNLGNRFGSDASIFRVATVQYFIALNANGEPELMRQEGTDAAVALFEGVESIQILYGEDSDNDGSANRYLDASQVVDMNNVVSIRLAFLLRTVEEVGGELDTRTYSLLGTVFDPVDDRRLRRVYSTTIKLRNRGRLS